MPQHLTRDEALVRLKDLQGQNLRELAARFNVTVFKPGGGFNKGWAGLLAERYLGMPPNNLQEADFGDWELKFVPLVNHRVYGWYPKETMAITMINPRDVILKPFEQSHLYNKLRRMIVGGRTFVDKQETSSILLKFETFDFDDHEDTIMMSQIKTDYENVRLILANAPTPEAGLLTLSGSMGVHVQPRTKGPGHGSTSRAFYMRIPALAKLLKLV